MVFIFIKDDYDVAFVGFHDDSTVYSDIVIVQYFIYFTVFVQEPYTECFPEIFQSVQFFLRKLNVQGRL